MPVKGTQKPCLGVHLWKCSTTVRLGKAEFLIMASVLDTCLSSLSLQIRPNCLPVVQTVSDWAWVTFWFCRVQYCKELNKLNETAFSAISKWGKGKIKTWLFPLINRKKGTPWLKWYELSAKPLINGENLFLWNLLNPIFEGEKQHFVKLLVWNGRISFIRFSAFWKLLFTTGSPDHP